MTDIDVTALAVAIKANLRVVVRLEDQSGPCMHQRVELYWGDDEKPFSWDLVLVPEVEA